MDLSTHLRTHPMKTITPAIEVRDEARAPSLYTIVIEFLGGTYVFQINSDNERAALSSWCDSVRVDMDFGPDSSRLADLIELEANAASLSLLNGLQSVWSFTTPLNDLLVLGHVVKTG